MHSFSVSSYLEIMNCRYLFCQPQSIITIEDLDDRCQSYSFITIVNLLAIYVGVVRAVQLQKLVMQRLIIVAVDGQVTANKSFPFV